MGNASSSSDSDGEINVETKDDDNDSDGDAESEKDSVPSFDLGALFEHVSLRSAATKVISDDMPESVIHQHHAQLVRWLRERQARNEDVITLSQFCNALADSWDGRDACIQAFQQFDSEGDGTADVSVMLETLRMSDKMNTYKELDYVVRTLQACPLTPGFIDVYNDERESVGEHGARILQFLLRNRAPSNMLPFPVLNSFNNTMQMRLSALRSHFSLLKESANSQQEESVLMTGEEVQPITKCFSSIEVSTNRGDANRLTNTDFSAYWQSNGSARSHWIRLRIKNNVVIRQLCVGVAASDQSYMPQLISISVGKNCRSLREVKEVRIPSHYTGDIVLFENAKMYYPVVQINIKRCHSDGCDTRIHCVKTIGYRIVKDMGVSVMDASACWYLQVLAATTAACIPTAPQLREVIIAHTLEALKHMAPLSLAPGSGENPLFLTPHVLHQMDTFLQTVSMDVRGRREAQGLRMLLAFNLARGHIAGLLQTLLWIQENAGVQLEAVSLLKSLDTVTDAWLKKQGVLLPLGLAGCDGGQKDGSSGPENILGNNWTNSRSYLTGDGVTTVNMIFKGHDDIQITKVRIKVEKGPRGPKHGMIFVYKSDDPFDLEKHVNKFKKIDSYTPGHRSQWTPGQPVAHFTVEVGWDEVEVSMDAYPIGQYILVRFAEPRQSTADRLGIVGIKFFGFERKSIFTPDYSAEDLLVLDSHDTTFSPETISLRILSFMVLLCTDQQSSSSKKAPSATKTFTLDTSDVTVDLIWKLYRQFKNVYCKILTLHLLHSLFPVLTNTKPEHKESAEAFFAHLCTLVDKGSTTEEVTARLIIVVKQIIIDGAAVFFPDKEARRKQLFHMMKAADKEESLSVTLTYQSLCQFFSSVDPSGLLDLPDTPAQITPAQITPAQEFDHGPVLAVLDMLVTVAYHEYEQSLSPAATNTDQARHLIQLLCSLQTSLLSWCHQQVDRKDDSLKHWTGHAQTLLINYVQLLAEKSIEACDHLLDIPTNEVNELVTRLDRCFLGTTLRQLVLVLTHLVVKLDCVTRVKLLHTLLPVCKRLKSLEPRLDQCFYKADSKQWKEVGQGEVVLRIWEVESDHNYDNDMHITQLFDCPGASSFIVEFDSRCETENRYDYLEFTDSRGSKQRYNQKTGTDKWPSSAVFKGGPRLHFLFHSDSSNNEWGYKFKVTAKGCPDVPLCWLFDLYLMLAKLFGGLCGACMDVTPVLPPGKLKEGDWEEDAEREMLRSSLWATLFRGGYMAANRLERSLSGKHMTDAEANMDLFLIEMLTLKEGHAVDFLAKCQERSVLPAVGGEALSEVVSAVFAALIWHTQSLREELEKYVKSKGDAETKIADGIHQAYTVAAGMRTFLLEQKQKQVLAAEKAGTTPATDSPDLVTLCKEKALFLLKFAGLTKVHLKSLPKHKMDRRSSKQLNKYHTFTGDKPVKIDSVLERYPSFRLVLDFVREAKWCKNRVERLLKERAQHAQSVAQVYSFTTMFIQLMGDDHIFQVPTMLFLQELLAHQDKFGQHYAEGIEGCGLKLEADVRRAYYALVRHLVDCLRNTNRLTLEKPFVMGYDYVQAATLHLLDIAWQPFDLSFLNEVKLPEFYMNLARMSVATRMKILSYQPETEELAEYEQNMAWLAVCKKGFYEWYNSKRKDKALTEEGRKDIQMFLARFCDLLDVEINCDGCGVTLPGHRYRCLQCCDMDLCANCYAGGVKPVGKHTDDHDIVHLMFKCDECQAFIVGTRIHCTVCEDFDLCLGCQHAGRYPVCHTSEHAVIKHPMVRLRMNKQPDSSLQSNIHNHVWLLFTSLSLTMANLLAGKHSPLLADADYVKAATELHNTAITLVQKCLAGVTVTEEVDDVNLPETLQTMQDEAFAVHSQERFMGLLGAMIPTEHKTPLADDVSSIFTSEEFLQLLFSIARGKSGHEMNTQHLAMGLIGKLLQRTATSCKIVDAALGGSSGEEEEEEEERPYGHKTAEFLFSFGATCLERSGLEWANSMAGILQQLFNSAPWRNILLDHLSQSISHLKQSQDLPSIFALFVVAGFPEVLSIGCHVQYTKGGADMKRGVVLKHFPDKNQTLLVDKKSRRRRCLWLSKDDYVERECRDIQVLDQQHIAAFISIIKDTSSRIGSVSGDKVSVESLWVLSLTLKGLLKAIQSSPRVDTEGEEAGVGQGELFTQEFVQCCVHLAKQGTGFSKLWLLKDLEILSLMLYTRDRGEKEEETREEVVASEDSLSLPPMELFTVHQRALSSDSDLPSDLSLETAQKCLEVLHEHLNVPMPVLRAILDSQDHDKRFDFIMAMHEQSQNLNTQQREEMQKWPKKWAAELAHAHDNVTDNGMVLVSPPQRTDKEIDVAVEEQTQVYQKLITCTHNDVVNDALKQRKSKSAVLLRRELEKRGKSGSRYFLLTVNMAMSVLYARQVLTALLADWPSAGHVITAELIGCKESAHVPFVLDLLNTPEASESFQKVVQNVITHCDPSHMVPIAMTSCQFMEEAVMSKVTRESPRQYNDHTSIEDHIHIPGAAFLFVSFYDRCATTEEGDQLVMSTSADYKENRHVFSGPKENWINFRVSGDSLYYKFTAECMSDDCGYKFTVTGGLLDRFNTGYLILNGVLSVPTVVRELPLDALWNSLLYVCCKQTEQQRLKAVQLLLKVMQTQFRPGASELSIDLGLLNPLWKLFNTMSRSNPPERGTIVPSVLRALTELFLIAESLALEWEMTHEYMVMLHDEEDVQKVVFQGLENIAAISLALGYKNKATEGFEALKRKKTSAGSVKLTVAVSGKEMSAHSSHAQ